MPSVVDDLSQTFQSITKDVTGVLSTVVTMGILIILLPVLLQMNKLIQSLSGVGSVGTTTKTTTSTPKVTVTYGTGAR